MLKLVVPAAVPGHLSRLRCQELPQPWPMIITTFFIFLRVYLHLPGRANKVFLRQDEPMGTSAQTITGSYDIKVQNRYNTMHAA